MPAGIQPGHATHKVAPVYPQEALEKRIEGAVHLTASISKEGKPTDIAVVDGDPLLVPAAIDAVKQWEYEPSKRNGEPVETKTSITLNFVLPERVRVSQRDFESMVAKKYPPEYPEKARMARIQGSVVLAVVVGKDGKMRDAKLVKGHPMLAPAAINAVQRWQYKPYLVGGQPVEVESQVTVNFALAY